MHNNIKFLSDFNFFKPLRRGRLFTSWEIDGGCFGLFFIKTIKIIPQNNVIKASINKYDSKPFLNILGFTIFSSITNVCIKYPIITPMVFELQHIDVTITLLFSSNQVAAIFAGEFKIAGWNKAVKTWPI